MLTVDVVNMKNLICFECGKPAEIEHHVIPRSKGGTKTIPLCCSCHSLVHDAKLLTNSELIKLGRERAKSSNAREEVIELHALGVPKTDIARRLKISRGSVYYILEHHGLYENTGRGLKEKITPDLLDKIKQARDNGQSWIEIEHELDICHTHLYRIIKEHGWYDGKYGGNLRNRDAYRTLTPDKIEEARALRNKNKTWDEIATILGVDRTTLYKHGIAQQFKPLRGQLTPEKKLQAVEMKRQGRTWKDIATELEVSVSSIYMSKIHKGL